MKLTRVSEFKASQDCIVKPCLKKGISESKDTSKLIECLPIVHEAVDLIPSTT